VATGPEPDFEDEEAGRWGDLLDPSAGDYDYWKEHQE
jgi:hypothetical protein